jgi:hypothetical protein
MLEKGINMRECEICGIPFEGVSMFCPRCRRLRDRHDRRGRINRGARINALRNAWDGETFRCHYTRVALETNPENYRNNPKYLTFDHLQPGNENRIVVCASFINDMKSDLSEDEFKRIVRHLAESFDTGIFNEDIIILQHFRR